MVWPCAQIKLESYFDLKMFVKIFSKVAQGFNKTSLSISKLSENVIQEGDGLTKQNMVDELKTVNGKT